MPFCTGCGTKLDDDARFCTGCGTAVDAEAAGATPSPAPATAVAPAAVAPAVAAPVASAPAAPPRRHPVRRALIIGGIVLGVLLIAGGVWEFTANAPGSVASKFVSAALADDSAGAVRLLSKDALTAFHQKATPDDSEFLSRAWPEAAKNELKVAKWGPTRMEYRIGGSNGSARLMVSRRFILLPWKVSKVSFTWEETKSNTVSPEDQHVDDENLPRGYETLAILGEDGKREVRSLVTVENGVPVDSKELSDKIVTEPTKTIWRDGTAEPSDLAEVTDILAGTEESNHEVTDATGVLDMSADPVYVSFHLNGISSSFELSMNWVGPSGQVKRGTASTLDGGQSSQQWSWRWWGGTFDEEGTWTAVVLIDGHPTEATEITVER